MNSNLNPGPDAGSRADGLAEGIARLRRALRRGARVADPGNTLAVAQLELLAALAEHPGSRPGQLARLLNMRPNTVTTIVNALTVRGMVQRVAAEADRRAVELTVTEAGQQAVLAWQATNAAVLHLALSTLPPKQRRALAAAVPALDALATAVDRLADTRPLPREPQRDRIGHGFVAEVTRVQAVTGVVDRVQVQRIVRIRGSPREVDDPVEGPAGADPVVDLLA
jgi:DNA-binding MarR family transcriptional regulator